METFNALGFTNFWSVSSSYDILNNEERNNTEENQNINIFLSNINDIHHILRTVAKSFEKKENLTIKFYVYEKVRENLARFIVLLNILNEKEISLRDRIELFMEIYGNSLLSSRTNEYLVNIIKKLTKFVCGDKNYKGPLSELIDLSNLSYKEKDEICEIFKSYDNKYNFDIDKYRDDRLRFMYKDRYDVRENLIDWDYSMNLNKRVINFYY